MNIHDQINEHFSDMGQEAKPIKLSDLEAEALRKAREHEDYERGVADCIKGVKHEDQSEAYNAGYGQEYSYQMAAQGRLCHE